MVGEYREPTEEVSVEMKISQSRFVGQVRICRNEDEVRDKLKEIWDLHKEATHNCWAYRIGETSFKEYFSDDGEPSGTAGKPILGAIAKQNLTNVLVVVTRYFGGTKLGIRGLIEAYGSVASEVLTTSGVTESVLKRYYRVECAYDILKTLNRQLFILKAKDDDLDFEYGEKVTLLCSIPLSNAPDFESWLEEMLQTERLISWEITGSDE